MKNEEKKQSEEKIIKVEIAGKDLNDCINLENIIMTLIKQLKLKKRGIVDSNIQVSNITLQKSKITILD